MGILVNRLLVMLNENESGTTFYYIALTLLEHIMELGNMNINEIAELCTTSKSTISKFIRALGYRSFSDFRYAVEMENNKYRSPNSYTHDVIGYLDEHTYEEYAQDLAQDMRSQCSLDLPYWRLWAAICPIILECCSAS